MARRIIDLIPRHIRHFGSAYHSRRPRVNMVWREEVPQFFWGAGNRVMSRPCRPVPPLKTPCPFHKLREPGGKAAPPGARTGGRQFDFILFACYGQSSAILFKNEVSPA